MSKRKHFKCKSQAQVYAIRRSYAERQEKERLLNNNNSNDNSFKLPLKSGEHTWNIYRVPNSILNGKQDNNVHGGLVLDEINNKVMLVEVTHQEYAKRNRKNLEIENKVSSDLNENGELRRSFLKKKLIMSVNRKGEEVGIDNFSLLKQLNDKEFTLEEKNYILTELSRLSTAEEKYKLFLKLVKEKADV